MNNPHDGDMSTPHSTKRKRKNTKRRMLCVKQGLAEQIESSAAAPTEAVPVLTDVDMAGPTNVVSETIHRPTR